MQRTGAATNAEGEPENDEGEEDKDLSPEEEEERLQALMDERDGEGKQLHVLWAHWDQYYSYFKHDPSLGLLTSCGRTFEMGRKGKGTKPSNTTASGCMPSSGVPHSSHPFERLVRFWLFDF